MLCKSWLDRMYIHQMSSSIRLTKISNLTFFTNYADVVDFKAWTRAESLSFRSISSLFDWHGTWRSTYFNIPRHSVTQVSCAGLFSDVLHRPFCCAHVPLLPYISNIPPSNALPRLSDISALDFGESWTNKPFILISPIRAWPVYRNWSTESMLSQYGDVIFKAETIDWPLKTYVAYMNDNEDESPLYLFDRLFVEKMGLDVGKGGQYWPPDCFGEDLFMVLGDQRPDSRWLIVGPQRSGSTFHKDPNATRSVCLSLLTDTDC